MNAELIKALRHCTNDLPCETESYRCKYADIWECNVQLRVDAADALEAAEKRIAELEAKCSRLESYNAELQRTIKSLQAQIPKRGEWIMLDPKNIIEECSCCRYTDYTARRSRYCPNCGARMKGEEK